MKDASRSIALALIFMTIYSKGDLGLFFGKKQKEWFALCRDRLYRFVFETPGRFLLLCFGYLFVAHSLDGIGFQKGFGYDIAIFLQSAFNAFHAKGLMYETIVTSNSFFQQHFEPYLFLFSPLADLPFAPVIFYSIQNLAQVGVVAYLVKYLNEYLGDDRNLKLAILFLLIANPYWFGLTHYEFHELSFVPFFAFVLFDAMKVKSFALAIFATITLVCLKETIPITLCWVGIVAFFVCKEKKQKLMAAMVSTVSLLAFGFYFGYVLPYYTGGGESMFNGYYSHLGVSKYEIILAPFLKPLAWFQAIFTATNIEWAALWALSGMGIAVIYSPFFLFALPDMYLLLVANGDNLKHFGNQYGGIMLMPFAISLIFATKKFRRLYPASGKWLCLIGCIIGLSLCNVRFAKSIRMNLMTEGYGLYSLNFTDYLEKIPKGDAIYTNSIEVLPFLARRDNLYISKEGYTASYHNSSGIHVIDTSTGASAPEGCALLMEYDVYKVCRKS